MTVTRISTRIFGHQAVTYNDLNEIETVASKIAAGSAVSRASGATDLSLSGADGNQELEIVAEERPIESGSYGQSEAASRPNEIEASMTQVNIQSVAEEQVFHLTTMGRTTGLAREIEIWFVVSSERFYVFAETGEAAGWVKNIRRHPNVRVRIGDRQIDATARVLDHQADRELWDRVAAIADRKYGWGDGLPVEITPASSPNTN
jgi:deazaflavin-dependent oxidoreductase (nitroreductase family)